MEGIADQHSVTVEQAYVAGSRPLYSLVLIPGVELVAAVPDQDYLRKSFGNHIGTSVGRAVVDANDLKADALSVAVYGLDAPAQQISCVVVRNADGDVEERFSLAIPIDHGHEV